MHKAAVLSQPR